MRFCAGKRLYIGLYDKERGRGRYCDVARIRDDLGLGTVPRIRGVAGNRFYCLVSHDDTDSYTPPEVVWFE